MLVVHLHHPQYTCICSLILDYRVRYGKTLLQSIVLYHQMNHSVVLHAFQNQAVGFTLKVSYKSILIYTICEILISHCFVIHIVCVSVNAARILNIIDFRHIVFYVHSETCL
jgi:hypothetical protein